MSDLSVRILDRLMSEFTFKTSGEWLREGICPHCNKKSLWTHAVNPRVVTCDRLNKCGYTAHVRDLCDDLFKSWSEHHPQTEISPNAAADAYLAIGRGLDISKFQGAYSQETYKKGNESSATVRFPLSNGGHWERLIDRPERFGKDKARFKYGVDTKGLWWIPPGLDLTKVTEIWITEGIFDAIALWLNGIAAVSSLSCNNYPAIGLAELLEQCRKAGIDRPTLVWAYDSDRAGQSGTIKHHDMAKADGWDSTAAQPPKNATLKIDWNDLHERGRLTDEQIETYKYYGKLLIAKTAEEAGLLIYTYRDGARKSFPYYHRLRLYWFNLDLDKFHKAMERLEDDNHSDLDEEGLRHQALRNSSAIVEICNAYIEPLYFQRNVITDESWYYIKIITNTGEVKATFTGDQISSPAKFKPRMLAIFPGVLWTGSAIQLDYCLKNSIEGLREIQTIDFIGYSRAHKAYIYHDIAFHRGQAIPINQNDLFKLSRIEAKTLAKSPELKITHDKPFIPDWYARFWRVRGVKGLIVLAWWMGSYFAEQIRELDNSYPFMELVGEPGAGKSHFIEFLWKISGRHDYEGFNPNKSTSVAVYRNFAQVSNLPVVLIEGDKENEEKAKQAFDWDTLKDAFNGRSIRSRGLKTAGNDTYEPPFRGAIMISQNATIQASEAILTRTIHLHVDRKGQTLKTKEIADELSRIPSDVASTFIAHCLKNEEKILGTYAEKVRIYEHDFHNAGITHTRVALCHAQISALVEALALHVFTPDTIDLDHVVEATDMLAQMARDRIQRLSSDHPDVEKFWDVYEYLSGLRDVAINHQAPTHQTIAINLNDFYKYAADHRQQLPDITIMKRLLSTSRRYKFVESNKAVRSAPRSTTVEDRIVKCWLFQKPLDGARTS